MGPEAAVGTSRRRAARATALAALVLALAVGAPACSGSDAGDGPEAREGTSAAAVDYRKQAGDVGGAAELGRLVNLLARMQHDFQAGATESVCENVSASWLSQFLSDAHGEDAPCRVKLAEFARRLERRGTSGRTLEIVWTRMYGAIVGITVRGRHLPRVRIPFVREDGAWKLQLGVFPAPEVLNADLGDG